MNKINSITYSENYLTEITSDSGIKIISDEPKSLGGQNKGLSPSELIIAALASCTSATLKMYTQRKGWDLQEVKTEIKLIKSEKNGELPTIHRKIKLIGELDEKQRTRILAIANKCPVHKIVSGEVPIDSELL